MNPIEHEWKLMKDELYKRYPDLYLLYGNEINREFLHGCLKAVWEAIPQEKIRDLIDSLDRRLQAVINAKG